MSRSKVKVELFYLSVGFSMGCLLLIWYLFVRLRRSDASRLTSRYSQSQPNGQSSYQSSSQQEAPSRQEVPTLEKESKVVEAPIKTEEVNALKIEEGKAKPVAEIKSILVDRIPVEKISIAVQTDQECLPQKIPHHVEMEQILKQELELERQRNNILEEEVNGIKEDLIKMKTARSRDHSQLNHQNHKIEESEYLNVKNQLEFCQMKLAQSYLSEQQLKSKLDKYERSSIYLINHPEYQRLRQLNNRYKDMIISLQKHLLTRHNTPPEEELDLSFNDL